MIEQMGEATAAGFVKSLSKGSAPAGAGTDGAKVQPYPEIDGLIADGEPLGAGYQPSDISASAAVGNMTSGMPKDGSSGAAKIGPGNMLSDFEPIRAGAEDTFAAPVVGDLVTGMPTDGKSSAVAELSPKGLTTGTVKAGTGTGHGVNGGQ